MGSSATATGTSTWRLDPAHSSVEFSVKHMMMTTVRGRFKEVEAVLTGDEEHPEGCCVEVTIRTASIDTGMPDRDAHLRGPDFFDAERFPELRFLAEDVDLDSETVEVPGEITIKGVTKPVDVTGTLSEPIEDAWGNQRLGLQLTATVDRTEFGLNWNMPLPTGDQALSNTVTVLAELQLVKAA